LEPVRRGKIRGGSLTNLIPLHAEQGGRDRPKLLPQRRGSEAVKGGELTFILTVVRLMTVLLHNLDNPPD
jgi:hypothetical protein